MFVYVFSFFVKNIDEVIVLVKCCKWFDSVKKHVMNSWKTSCYTTKLNLLIWFYIVVKEILSSQITQTTNKNMLNIQFVDAL